MFSFAKTTSGSTPSTFGFGTSTAPAAATAPTQPFSFGTPAASAAPAFGATSSAPAFGATSTSTSAFSFGATQPAQPSTTSNLFGAPAASSSSTGLFGATNTASNTLGSNLFGKPAQTTTIGQPQTQAAANSVAQSGALIYQAVTKPQIYGDERDQIIASWNGVQAAWGKGRCFAGQNKIDVQPNDEWSLFKSVRYIEVPTYK